MRKTQNSKLTNTTFLALIRILVVVLSLVAVPVISAGGQQEQSEEPSGDGPAGESTRIEISPEDEDSDADADAETQNEESSGDQGTGLRRTEDGDVIAPIDRPAWLLGFHPNLDSAQGEISETIENGYIPAGMEVDPSGQITVMYLASFDVIPERWILETYEPEQVNDGITERLLQGWNPLGFSVLDGTLSVMYGSGGQDVSAWRIHESELDPSQLSGTIERYQNDGFALVDLSVDPADDVVWYLFVEQEGRSGGPGSQFFINAYPIGEDTAAGITRDFTEGRGVPFAYAAGSAVALTVFVDD